KPNLSKISEAKLIYARPGQQIVLQRRIENITNTEKKSGSARELRIIPVYTWLQEGYGQVCNVT
ncbi:hypothetical protein L9F63_009851, partial [Diploptera punctata]